MLSDDIEQRCNIRTERIIENLLHWNIDDDDDMPGEVLTFDMLLSELDNYYSILQEKDTVPITDNGFKTRFTEVAHEFLKLLCDESSSERISSNITGIMADEMESRIAAFVHRHFSDLFRINGVYNEEEHFFDDIFNAHCVPCAEIIWEECKYCILSFTISDLIDDAIIDQTAENFIDLINLACESTLKLLKENVPSTICLTFHNILDEILDLLNTRMDTADPTWEIVGEEVSSLFDLESADIAQKIYHAVDYDLVTTYIDVVEALYAQHRRNMRDKDVNRIAEEVRSMEI